MRATLILLAVLSALLLASLGGASSNLGVARFGEQQVSHAVTGFKPGDVEVWRTQVVVLKRSKVIGTGAFACIYIDFHTSVRECQGTYILPRGRIQVAGEIISRSSFQLTIVGGTGVYTGVGGTAVFRGSETAHIITFYLS